MPSMTNEVYANWVAKEILGETGNLTPAQWIQKHRDGWRHVLLSINDPRVSGVYEVVALVISRWEFLGRLYRGRDNEQNEGSLDARTYAERFLEPVNPRYGGVHNLVARANQQPNQSDIFQMGRNKPLHGVHPAGIATEDGLGVVGWRTGPGDTGSPHLLIDAEGNLHINGSTFVNELMDSMTLFAAYLNQNTERAAANVLGNRLPSDRWLRAHWARHKPHGADLNAWMALGVPRGIPA